MVTRATKDDMIPEDVDEDPKVATKEKAGKPKEVKTGLTKTATKDAPAQEDAEDAVLDEQDIKDTAKTNGKAVIKAEDEDDRDHDDFKSWEAGERILRQEKRKFKVRAMKEAERKGKTGDVQAWKRHLHMDKTNEKILKKIRGRPKIQTKHRMKMKIFSLALKTDLGKPKKEKSMLELQN